MGKNEFKIYYFNNFNNNKKMSVVNCKVNNIRPQYKNLKEWINDPNNVYIGRAGVVFIEGSRFPKITSISNFANPYKIGKDGTRDEVIQKYKTFITEKVKDDIILQQELIKMKNKNLGCWCFPEPCHGNVLLELIDKYYSKKHEILPDYDYFEDECSICQQLCNELSGWKCEKCNNCYCDEHNDEEFTCNC
jgi:hypothetical protein